MTGSARPAEATVTGLPEMPRHPTAPRRRWPRAALITAVCVAAGFFLGATYLPGPPTPTHAAAVYMEARYARDWHALWDLLCRSTRAAVDYDTLAERLDYVADYTSQPTDVDIEIGDMDLVPVGSRSYFAVSVRVTSDERTRDGWVFDGELPLVQEDGGFRVCLPGAGASEQ